jgi:hypothetical protein
MIARYLRRNLVPQIGKIEIWRPSLSDDFSLEASIIMNVYYAVRSCTQACLHELVVRIQTAVATRRRHTVDQVLPADSYKLLDKELCMDYLQNIRRRNILGPSSCAKRAICPAPSLSSRANRGGAAVARTALPWIHQQKPKKGMSANYSSQKILVQKSKPAMLML